LAIWQRYRCDHGPPVQSQAEPAGDDFDPHGRRITFVEARVGPEISTEANRRQPFLNTYLYQLVRVIMT
jgi:hypothetical protein